MRNRLPLRLAARARRLRPAAPVELRAGNDLLPMLRCPTCRTELRARGDRLRCRGGHVWPIVSGVPVFTQAGRSVEQRPDDHTSNVPGSHGWQALVDGPAPWLHLGAGATAEVLPGSIELETAIFPNTAVVGDVHHLPFADATFTGVLALNVFEHVEDPERAASELHRVLRPGALAIVQTAFLQPQHADPHHYYNATETGLRRWFRDFDIESVDVPGNFEPLFALSWQVSDLLWHADDADAEVLAGATLGELATIWRDPASWHGPVFDSFRRLPDAAMRTLAAGFELRARRP